MYLQTAIRMRQVIAIIASRSHFSSKTKGADRKLAVEYVEQSGEMQTRGCESCGRKQLQSSHYSYRYNKYNGLNPFKQQRMLQ
jgi:hypothetical protein